MTKYRTSFPRSKLFDVVVETVNTKKPRRCFDCEWRTSGKMYRVALVKHGSDIEISHFILCLDCMKQYISNGAATSPDFLFDEMV